MQKSNSNSIKSRGFVLSSGAIIHAYFVSLGTSFGFIILGIPLMHFFPVLKNYGGFIVMIPMLLVVLLMLLYILVLFCTVVFEPDIITLKFFGITIRKIPVSKFKTFCAVGNEKEDVLCLSPYSIDEMADMEEKRLLRSFYYKHNVPFRKRKESWKIDFVRDFLNRIRRSFFGAFKDKNIVMFEIHSALQYSLRQMYPQLPYVNCTVKTSYYETRLDRARENEAVCYTLAPDLYMVQIEPDGIHISTKKKEVTFIPAQQIKTAVRVDIFREYEKFNPHHAALLYISNMSEKELAEHPKSKGYGDFILSESDNRALMAMTAATHLAFRWTYKNKNSCVIHLTKKNLEAVQTLYPHVQFNDISSCWLNNSLDTPSR